MDFFKLLLMGLFDLSGGTWVGLWSAVLLGLSVRVTLTGHDLPTGVIAAYSVVVGAYATSKTVHKVCTKDRNNGPD